MTTKGVSSNTTMLRTVYQMMRDYQEQLPISAKKWSSGAMHSDKVACNVYKTFKKKYKELAMEMKK